MCSQRQLLFFFSLHSDGFRKEKKKNFDIHAEISTIININIKCRMEKKRRQRFSKLNLVKFSPNVIAPCLFCMRVHRCVYIFHFDRISFDLFLFFSRSPLSSFSCSLSFFLSHSSYHLFALNFVFIHYINSFLIEISPSEFCCIPHLVHHRWLVYFHKQHIAWPRENGASTDTFGGFFQFIFEYNLWYNTIFDTSST